MEEINEGIADAFKAALRASGVLDIDPNHLGDNGLATLGKSGNPRFKSALGSADGSDVMVYDVIMLYAAHAFRSGGGELEKSQAQYLKKVTKGLYTLWKKKDDKSMQQYHNWVDYLASQNASRAGTGLGSKVSMSQEELETMLATAGEAGRKAGAEAGEAKAHAEVRDMMAKKYPEVAKALAAADTDEERAAILKKHPEAAEDIKKMSSREAEAGEAEAGAEEAGAEETGETIVHLYSKPPGGGKSLDTVFKKYNINDRVTKSIIDSIAAQLKVNGVTVKEGKEMDFLVSEVAALMEGVSRAEKARRKVAAKKEIERRKKAAAKKAASAPKAKSEKPKSSSARATSTKPESGGRSGGRRKQPSNAWKKRGHALGTEWTWGHPSTKDMSLSQWKKKIEKREKEGKISGMKRKRDRLETKQYMDILDDVKAQVARHGRAKKGRLNVGPLIGNALKAGGYEKDVRNKLARIIKKAFKAKAEKLGIRLTESKINSLTEEAVTTLLAKRVLERIDSDGML